MDEWIWYHALGTVLRDPDHGPAARDETTNDRADNQAPSSSPVRDQCLRPRAQGRVASWVGETLPR